MGVHTYEEHHHLLREVRRIFLRYHPRSAIYHAVGQHSYCNHSERIRRHHPVLPCCGHCSGCYGSSRQRSQRSYRHLLRKVTLVSKDIGVIIFVFFIILNLYYYHYLGFVRSTLNT